MGRLGVEGIRMKGFDVLLAIGGILLVFGLISLPVAVLQNTQPIPWVIAAGGNNLGRFEFDTLTGGTLSGTFVVTSGGTITVYVLDQQAHDALLAGQPFTPLDQVTGSSGTFSANLPSGGAYFVELQHGSGYETTVQSGTGTVIVDAVSRSTFIGAVVLIAIGAALLVAGLWWRRKTPKPSMTAPPPYRPGQYYAYPPPYIPPGQQPPQEPGKPPAR